LSAILSVAVRAPVAEGVNVTAIVHPAPAATELPQVLFSAKSPALVPVRARLLILKAVVPVLVRVTICTGLVMATDPLLKVRLLGEKLTVGGVLAPVPERLTV
jgi:hypothetical protein